MLYIIYRIYYTVNIRIKYILATLILLSVILSVQHITEYIMTDKKELMIKKLTEPFCYIHTARTLSLLLGVVFIDYCYWFILLAFTISQLFPIIYVLPDCFVKVLSIVLNILR